LFLFNLSIVATLLQQRVFLRKVVFDGGIMDALFLVLGWWGQIVWLLIQFSDHDS
jgi:hypothetical protein